MVAWGFFWAGLAVLWLGYIALIGFYRSGWRLPAASLEDDLPDPRTFVSVLVAARNEAGHLPALLAALRNQNYPPGLFEVVLIDDHSEDDTFAIANAAGGAVHALRLPAGQAGKKAAIAYGITQARGTWIVTTDADCVPGPRWLSLLMQHSDGASFLAAPVRYLALRTFCDRFQALDFMTLQGITAASVETGFHSMCNGANLAYTKEAFEEVGGFAGVDHIASGDDLLLMHKIARRHPQGVRYINDPGVIVETEPAPGWRAFWRQRVRWASKSAQYNDRRIFWALLLVYAFNFHFIALAVWSVWNGQMLWLLLGGLILKTIVEIRFLGPVAHFYGQQHLLRWFPVMQPLHIL
ncbi:MAG: glycosyltransferase [Chitinophagaceae bacterium]|nr:MAG: glycosyltransferase [Chitinophagaceae bacterium]